MKFINIYILKKDYSKLLPKKWHRNMYTGNAIFLDKKGVLRLVLYEDSLFIPKGYSTDGCTPKMKIFGWIVGTPDGPTQKDGYPQTYWASLVHDALCQFQHNEAMPYTRKEIDELFFHMLKECGWKWARLYYWAVRIYSKITFQDI